MRERPVRVSYLLSTRNRARFLAEALRNVREFMTPADELIIIDGGSTDDTSRVVEANRDIVRLFVSEPDNGEAHGFNKGILASAGRYIKALTDDDYFYPDAMNTAIDVMESHPELDAIQCGGEAYFLEPSTGESRLYVYLHLPPERRLCDDVRNIFDYVSTGLGLILARKVVARVGLFDTRYRAVDTDYMGRLIAQQAVFKYLNVKLYRHNIHPGSGQNNWPECRRDRIRTLLLNRNWAELMNHEIYPPSAIAEVLGLSDCAGGESLMELLVQGEKFRKERRLRSVLPVFTRLMKAIIYCARFVLRWSKRFRNHSDRAGVPLPEHQQDVEPKWDGSLR